MFRGKLTLPMHAALELLTATALIAAPFAIGLSFDATLAAGIIGLALFGLALSATETEGRGTLPIAAHARYDTAIVLVLMGAAVAFGFAGQSGAVALLLAAGAAQLALASATRYSPAHH